MKGLGERGSLGNGSHSEQEVIGSMDLSLSARPGSTPLI